MKALTERVFTLTQQCMCVTHQQLLTGKDRESVDARHTLAQLLADTGLSTRHIASALHMSQRAVTYALTSYSSRTQQSLYLRNTYEMLKKRIRNELCGVLQPL